MNLPSLVVLFLLLAAVGLALRSLRKTKGACKGCSCACGSCPGACEDKSTSFPSPGAEK